MFNLADGFKEEGAGVGVTSKYASLKALQGARKFIEPAWDYASTLAGNAGSGLGRFMSGGHGFQKSAPMQLLGSDPLEQLFTGVAAAEGARQGYEVGGVGGAVAGGFGGGAGARIAHGGLEAMRRGILQPGVAGALQSLGRADADSIAKKVFEANPGGFRRAAGRGVKGMEDTIDSVLPEWAATALKNKGKAWLDAGTAAGEAYAKGPTKLKGPASAMTLVGATMLGDPIADMMSQTTMDAYKHTIGGANARETRRRGMENRIRNINPDLGPIAGRNFYGDFAR